MTTTSPSAAPLASAPIKHTEQTPAGGFPFGAASNEEPEDDMVHVYEEHKERCVLSDRAQPASIHVAWWARRASCEQGLTLLLPPASQPLDRNRVDVGPPYRLLGLQHGFVVGPLP